MSEGVEAGGAKPYPSAAAGWTLVVFLTIAYIFSFIDRYILNYLVEPIKDEFGLSDAAMGTLFQAFTIVYGVVGLLMGWLIDRGRRVWIVSIGIALWSAATVATGTAKNYSTLFLARMGVGVGEATLSPAAFSIIGDSFPQEKRGRPIAFYSAALPLGAGIASLVSAVIIAFASSGETQYLPFFGELSAWRFTLVVVGLPGVLFALIFALVLKEPARRNETVSTEVIGGSSPIDALKYLWQNALLFIGIVSVVCAMTGIAYSQSWLPATFERTFGWAPEKYALINGIAILVIGPLNMWIMGGISDRWTSKGVPDAALRLVYIGFFIMIPTAAIPMFVSDGNIAFAILCINTVGIGIVSAIGVTALLAVIPPQVRGQTIAIYYLVISVVGGFGPKIVGNLSSNVFGEDNIRLAVACVPVIFAIIPLVMMPYTRREYLRQMKRVAGESSEAGVFA